MSSRTRPIAGTDARPSSRAQTIASTITSSSVLGQPVLGITIAANPPTPPTMRKQVLEGLLSLIRDHIEGAEPFDDTTIVVVRSM
jgi:hypothetical protein